jgi:hypothetical protein
MERLKEDIDVKAEKFEHIDYYDALLRDGNSKDTAVAAGELHEMDERRKPLISVNPLFAKNSEMPPVPTVEELTYQHISLNLPSIAKNALRELDEDLIQEQVLKEEFEEESDVQNESEIDTESEISSIEALSEVDNEEDDTSDEQVEEDESDLYTEAELNELTDDDIKQILIDWEIPMENFERELAIVAILEAQNEDEEDNSDEDNNEEDDDENEDNEEDENDKNN